MEEKLPRLENWSIDESLRTVHLPPKQKRYQLLGEVHCHSSIKDGTYVRTSVLVENIDFKTMTARTKNTRYSLGVPDKAWVQWLIDNKYQSGEELIKHL